MKLLILLCLLTVQSYAQGVIIHDISFSNGIKSITVVDSCNSVKEKYTFDKKNRQVEFCLNDSYSDRTEYLYDGDNLTEQLDYRGGVVKYQLIYAYDSNLLQSLKEIADGKIISEDQYFYEKGKLVKTRQFYKDTIDFIVKYRYDKKSGLNEEIHISNDNTTSIRRKYETKNKIVEQWFNRNDSLPHQETIRQVDKDGNVTLIREFQNGKEMPTTKLEYNRKILKRISIYNTAGGLKSEIIFDDRGNPIKEIPYNSEDVITAENKYDIHGNLVQVKMFKNGEFVCEKKYLIQYR